MNIVAKLLIKNDISILKARMTNHTRRHAKRYTRKNGTKHTYMLAEPKRQMAEMRAEMRELKRTLGAL